MGLSREEIEKYTRQANEGNDDAFDKLYRHFKRRVQGWCRKKLEGMGLREDMSVEDVVQIVFLRVYLQIKKGEVEFFAAYLYNVAQNTCKDKKLRPEPPWVRPRPGSERAHPRDVCQDCLKRVQAKLPDKWPEMFQAWADGSSIKECAEKFEMKHGTALAGFAKHKRTLVRTCRDECDSTMRRSNRKVIWRWIREWDK